MKFFKFFLIVKPYISFEAVGFRDVKDAKNVLTDNMIPSVEKFYRTKAKNLPYYLTVRSSIVQVSSKGRFDNNEYFGEPIRILLNYNEIIALDLKLNITTLRNYICLGQLVNEQWECASRVIKQLLKRENSPSKQPMIEYELPGPGTFAVIFKPKNVKNS